MRLTAHYSHTIGQWATRCGMVTSRGEGFNVYLYETKGEYEFYHAEHSVNDVNEALRIAREFGKDADSLEVIDETNNYEELAYWRK